jgi:hypothetical protein
MASVGSTGLCRTDASVDFAAHNPDQGADDFRTHVFEILRPGAHQLHRWHDQLLGLEAIAGG